MGGGVARSERLLLRILAQTAAPSPRAMLLWGCRQSELEVLTDFPLTGSGEPFKRAASQYPASTIQNRPRMRQLDVIEQSRFQTDIGRDRYTIPRDISPSAVQRKRVVLLETPNRRERNEQSSLRLSIYSTTTIAKPTREIA